MSESMPYVPLDPRGWRHTVGLRPLEDSTWLEFDGNVDEELAQKSALLAEHYARVVATNQEGDEASRELLEEVQRYLEAYHPRRPRETSPDEHAIVQVSRLAQEDFCVLVKDDAWRLRAACVCFPSRWDLTTKIGTTLDDIHAPVPLYDVELARPTNGFFDRLRPEKSFWRLNWTLLDSPALHQPRGERRAPSGELADWYFRVERQTLRQLPRTHAIVFTIRTYVASAAALARREGDFVASLLHSLDSAPESIQTYKGWHGVAATLRDTLTNG